MPLTLLALTAAALRDAMRQSGNEHASGAPQDAKKLRFPAPLEGRAPYLWQFGNDSFRVLSVRPFFAGGETDLAIRVELPSLNDVKVIEGLSHALIGHLTNAYPEIFRSFDAIVVEAVEANGVRNYRTVQYGHGEPQ